jgi:hypothetical protein
LNAIPLSDAAALQAAAHTTRALRTALALVCAGAAAAAVFVSRDPNTRTVVPLPRGAGNVLVLDLSASISSDTFSRIGGTLEALSRSGRRFGLVLFSDQAYEALPPGSPAADLAPFVRYFTLPKQRALGFAPSFPHNPWQADFSGGTRISAGLELARTLAGADGRHGSVVLVSDLDDEPSDVPRLASVLLEYRRMHVPIRIVGLSPSPENAALFDRLVSPRPVLVQAPTVAQAAPYDVTPFPWLLVLLAVVSAASFAVLALWAPRLDWGIA